MKPSLQFYVAGVPRPAGSKRYFPIRKGGQLTGKAVIVDMCAKSTDWKADVRNAAVLGQKAAGTDELLSGPIRVSFRFQVTRPKNHYGTGKKSAVLKSCAPSFPTTRPDLLKYARGIEDSLTGLVYRDDSQIVTELLTKRYADKPGVYIEIAEECA